nr:hypothetical protein [Tanacetum cinerariifolium]
MHILNEPSFFLTNKTGVSQGEELGLIKPSSKNSCSCSDNSFISDGAKRYGARATGATPGTRSIGNSTGRAWLTWQILRKHFRKVLDDRYVFDLFPFRLAILPSGGYLCQKDMIFFRPVFLNFRTWASAVALRIYLAYVPNEEEFQYLAFILAILVPVIVLAIGVDLCLKN